MRIRSLTLLLVLLTAVAVAPAISATVKPAVPVLAVDLKTRDMVKHMSDYLTGLHQFSVHVDAINEVVLPTGQRLDTDSASDLSVERPNKMRIDTVSAARQHQIYYDGKNVTVYTPDKKYYGTWAAPPTIDQMVKMAHDKYGTNFPITDIVLSDISGLVTRNAVSGRYVGDTLIHGVKTHHLAFRGKSADWQVWINASDDTPLPVRFVITDKAARDKPQYFATLSDWNTNPTFGEDTFAFVPPPDARKIKVSILPGASRPTGAGPKRVK